VLGESVGSRRAQGVAYSRGALREDTEAVRELADSGDPMLEKTLEMWSAVTGLAPSPGDLLQTSEGRQGLDGPRIRSGELPRRVRHFQLISPTLTEGEPRAEMELVSPRRAARRGFGRRLPGLFGIVERILGVEAACDGLRLRPDSDSWNECRITRRFRGDAYNIRVTRPTAPATGASRSWWTASLCLGRLYLISATGRARGRGRGG